MLWIDGLYAHFSFLVDMFENKGRHAGFAFGC